MNIHCNLCDREPDCGYEFKPTECCDYRKFTPKRTALTMVKVESSQVDSIGHDGSTLTVKFKTGGTYQYADVPAETLAAVMVSKSVGAFLHAHIKPKYKATKVVEAAEGGAA